MGKVILHVDDSISSEELENIDLEIFDGIPWIYKVEVVTDSSCSSNCNKCK